jgi:autotransporter-associated beta strand protein
VLYASAAGALGVGGGPVTVSDGARLIADAPAVADPARVRLDPGGILTVAHPGAFAVGDRTFTLSGGKLGFNTGAAAGRTEFGNRVVATGPLELVAANTAPVDASAVLDELDLGASVVRVSSSSTGSGSVGLAVDGKTRFGPGGSILLQGGTPGPANRGVVLALNGPVVATTPGPLVVEGTSGSVGLFDAANDFDGVVAKGGAIVFEEDAALGRAGGAIKLEGGAIRYRGATPYALARPIVMDGGEIAADGAGLLTVPATTPLTAGRIGGTRWLGLGGSGRGRFDATIGDVGGPTGLSVRGTGEWTVTGANSFTGGVTVTDGATLRLGNAAALGAKAQAVSLNGSGKIDLYGFDLRAASLTQGQLGDGAITSSAPGDLTVDLGGGSTTAAIGGGPATISLVKSGAGTLTLYGANTYTGPTTVLGGLLTLGKHWMRPDAVGRLANTSALTITGGGRVEATVQTGMAPAVNAAPLTLGGDGGGGTFSFDVDADAVSGAAQSFTSLTLRPGLNALGTLDPAAAALTFTGPVTRTAGAMLNVFDVFTPTGRGNGFGVRLASPPPLVGGILGGGYVTSANGTRSGGPKTWMTLNAAGYLVPFTAFVTADDPNDTSAAGWVAANNVTAYHTSATPMGGPRTVNTLRVGVTGTNPAATTVDLGGHVLMLEAGGLMPWTSNSKTSTPNSVVNGSIRVGAAAPDLVVYGESDLAVAARLDLGPKALTLGSGRVLTLSNPSNSVTDIYVNSGTLRTAAQGALGAEAGTVYLHTGRLAAAGGDQVLANKRVVVGSSGGGLTALNESGRRFEVAAPVRLDGPLAVGGGAVAGTQTALALTGPISGRGGLTENGNGTTPFRLEISGHNTFTGGVTLNHEHHTAHSVVTALGSDAAFGTGTVVTVRYAALESTGGPRTIANAVAVAGNLRITGTGDFTFTGPFSFSTGPGYEPANLETTGPTVTLAGPLRYGFTKSGPGTVVVAAPIGVVDSLLVNAGTLRVNARLSNLRRFEAWGMGTLELGTSQVAGSVWVRPGGLVRLLPGRDKVLVTPVLAHDAAGTIDLTDNALVYDYTGASAVATVADAVRRGYAGGAWDGAGFRSSTAAADPSLGVGYAEAAQLLGPAGGTFMGHAVDGTAMILRTTLLGDATLDGVVDFADLVRLAQNYEATSGSMGWLQGDFTYDGVVDFADLVRLAQNYEVSLPILPAGASADLTRDLAIAFARVPDPAGAGALLLAAGASACRRRHRRRT